MSDEVIIDRLVNRIKLMPSAGGIGDDTVRRIVEALLPAVQEMIGHQRQVTHEASTSNGYFDWMEGRAP